MMKRFIPSWVRSCQEGQGVLRRGAWLLALRWLVLLLNSAVLAQGTGPALTNRAERLEWFRDQGFGLFIHWSLDSQFGLGHQPLDGRGRRGLSQPLH